MSVSSNAYDYHLDRVAPASTYVTTLYDATHYLSLMVDVGVASLQTAIAQLGESFASPPVMYCGALAAGVVGTAYSATLAVVNGNPAYAFALASGALPTGLSLNATTGVISGTPMAVGSYSFGVTVTDSLGQATTETFAIAVTAGTSPAGSGSRAWVS